MKSWSSVVKTPIKNNIKNKLQNNHSLDLLINDYFKQAPNVLPIIDMIYYFRLICKNFDISIDLSYFLAKNLINYLQPQKLIFKNWIQKVKIENYSLHTSKGLFIRDKYVNSDNNLGYDIVSSWGLSTKIFNKYYQDKYFFVNCLNENQICINFYKDSVNHIWCNKLELDLSKWYIGSLYKFVNTSNDFNSFKQKILELNKKLRLNTYTLDPKYNYIKLNQIYNIYKKIIYLDYDLTHRNYSNWF